MIHRVHAGVLFAHLRLLAMPTFPHMKGMNAPTWICERSHSGAGILTHGFLLTVMSDDEPLSQRCGLD